MKMIKDSCHSGHSATGKAIHRCRPFADGRIQPEK